MLKQEIIKMAAKEVAKQIIEAADGDLDDALRIAHAADELIDDLWGTKK